MFDGLLLFGESIVRFGTPETIAYALLASLVGVVMGALPGLTATMALALMTTLTLKLPPSQALLILICTYVGSIYGGSRSAILLNIPGTPASAASCLDGYQLARQGKAGVALSLSAWSSFIGGTIEVTGGRQIKSFFEVVSVANLTGEAPFDLRWHVSDGSGKNLFFNIIIEGVNMLSTERSEIGALLDQRKGDLDRLIADLNTL